jgi:signal transduction histidine kinase
MDTADNCLAEPSKTQTIFDLIGLISAALKRTLMHLILWLRYGLLAALTLATIPSLATGVVLDKAFSHFDMSGHISASPVKSEIATAEEALRRYRNAEFEALPGNLARGYRKESVWLVFELETHDAHNESTMLTVGPAYTERITAYQTLADGSLERIGASGSQVPQSEKAIRSLTPAFAVDLRNARHTTVLLHIQTVTTQAAFVTLHHWALYPEVATNEAMVASAILCACALMLLLAAGMYVAYRDRLYLLWFAYLAVTSVVWARNNGLLAYYYASSKTQLISDIGALTSVLSFCVAALLVTHVFRFRSLAIWLHRLFLGWALLIVFMALAGFALQWRTTLGWLMLSGLPMLVISAVSIALQMRQRLPEAMIHGPLFLGYLGVTFYYIAVLLGAAESSEAIFLAWQIAGLCNVFSLQVAMLLRARQSLRNDAAERERLNQALTTQNERLEGTVALHTQSLNIALEAAHLREADQRQFIAMLSHEVRSPMAVIGATAELLSVHLQDQPQHQPLLQRVQRGVARLSNFFDNCLTQDRVYSHSYTLDPVDVNVVNLISMARESAEALSDAHQLVMEMPEIPVIVSGDAVLLRIAVMNLLVNAFKFSPSGSTVTLRVARLCATCRIEVQDQGLGVPEKERGLIFQKYRRGGAAERTPGAGLGLAIVQGIVDLHHGTVHVDSAPGGGSLFVVELPCSPSKAAQMQ